MFHVWIGEKCFFLRLLVNLWTLVTFKLRNVVVSNIIFWVLFVLFSYSWTYYKQLSILWRHRFVNKQKSSSGEWTLTCNGWGIDFLSFHRALFIIFIQITLFVSKGILSRSSTKGGHKNFIQGIIKPGGKSFSLYTNLFY